MRVAVAFVGMSDVHPIIVELVAARKRAGIAAAEVARCLGVSRQHVYNWEAGRNRPTLETMGKYAEVVGCVVVMQVVEGEHAQTIANLTPESWGRVLRYARAVQVLEPAELRVVDLTLASLVDASGTGKKNGNGNGNGHS